MTTQKVTWHINQDVHTWVKEQAAKAGMTQSAFVSEKLALVKENPDGSSASINLMSDRLSELVDQVVSSRLELSNHISSEQSLMDTFRTVIQGDYVGESINE